MEGEMTNRTIGGLIGAIASIVWAATSAQAEIKIGIAGPLSGSTLNVGEQQEIGAQKAIAHLNGKGGLLGQEIVATSVDDACNPEQAKRIGMGMFSRLISLSDKTRIV